MRRILLIDTYKDVFFIIKMMLIKRKVFWLKIKNPFKSVQSVASVFYDQSRKCRVVTDFILIHLRVLERLFVAQSSLFQVLHKPTF